MLTNMKNDVVMAGLDPAIHPVSHDIFSMDARVGPAHDGAGR
ncbi:hypothetical protein [Pseudorhodoplanes sp.]|jgi:hypothetical protein|nr:hypothetical protein [Pseudorhodoplanes sp.]HWV41212.1 hypothetical protein [Pseudorhodoplanes sp.]